MIAERIYKGETAEQIGIPEIQFINRKAVVDRFLAQWVGGDFVADYLAWLPTQDEGGSNDDKAHRSQGLGDTIAKTIKKVSGGKIKPCGGCKSRQSKLNKLFPYKEK